MNTTMTRFKYFVLASLIVMGLVQPQVHAQAPAPAMGQPIRIVVPYAAGGLVDATARIVAQRMGQSLHQAVIIENRAGGNANIGPTVVIQAPADGRTLLATGNFFIANPLLENNLAWNPKKFVPIGRYATAMSALVVPKNSKANTVAELVTLAKNGPSLPVVYNGPGNSQTLTQEVLQKLGGFKFMPVQYRGGTTYVTDLMTGRLEAGVVPLNVAQGLIRNGDVKALAIVASERSLLFPNVPTLAEAGFGDATFESWLGFHALQGTDPEIISRIARALEETMLDPDVRAKLTNMGALSAYLPAAEFESFLQLDRLRTANSMGIKLRD